MASAGRVLLCYNFYMNYMAHARIQPEMMCSRGGGSDDGMSLDTGRENPNQLSGITIHMRLF